MRSLTPTAEAEIAKKTGTEPMMSIDIYWTSSHVVTYTDRDKILSVSGLDSIIKLAGGGSSGTLNIKLDDTDGTIKLILNERDVHKCLVKVYQQYHGMSITDRFLLLTGEICTPIVWGEGDRTFSFEIVSKIESREVGFSPEQGQYDYIMPAAIGVAWPLVFGSCINVPAVKITESPVGQSFTQDSLPSKGSIQPLSATAKAYGRAKFNKETADDAVGMEDDTYRNYVNTMNDTMVTYENMRSQLLQENPDYKIGINDLGNICVSIGEKEAEVEYIDDELTSIREQIERYDATITRQEDRLIELYAEVPPRADVITAVLTAKDDNVLARNILIYDGTLLENELTTLLGQIGILRQQEVNKEKQLLDFVQGDYVIDNGDTFSQAVDTNIYVNGARIKGRFWGRAFTISYTEPLAWDIAIINNPAHDGSYNTLYVDAGLTESLRGCCCLILSDYNTPESNYRVVYVHVHELTTGKITFSPITWGISDDGKYQPKVLTSGTIVEAANSVLSRWSNYLYEKYSSYSYSSVDDLNYAMEPDFIVMDKTPSIAWTMNIGDDIYGGKEEIYVVNLIPNTTVKSVYGKRTINGKTKLVPIPSSYYSVDDDFAPGGRKEPTFEVTILRFHRSLASYHNEQWSDEVYVTMVSPEGPHTTDIIEYLVDNYTDLTVDATSFAAVKAALVKYPSHFPILDRPDAITVIEDIAWQARCAVWISNKVMYIKYLAAEESAVTTISESNVMLRSLKITYTETEELVTKLTALWVRDYAVPDKLQVVLRNNIPKYGLLKQERFFFIYNIESLVIKSATFWLIRLSNTWKYVSFTAFLDQLKVETMDTVTLNFSNNLISDNTLMPSGVKGTVEQVVYDSDSLTLNFNVWTSVRSGEMVPYTFAWPATAMSGMTYPTSNDLYVGGEH